MLQLNPPLPLLTPKGEGLAYLVNDLGPEHDLQWTVFMDDSGEIWTFMNRDVRASKNITMHRTHVKNPKSPPAKPVLMNGELNGLNGHGDTHPH